MSVSCQAVEFHSKDTVSRIRSSDWAERGFCSACGSNLFYHVIGSTDYQVAAGLFDDQSMMRLSLQLFTDFKPAFYDFSNTTRMMTADEVVAAFAPPDK